jgi:hypothetical protein
VIGLARSTCANRRQGSAWAARACTAMICLSVFALATPRAAAQATPEGYTQLVEQGLAEYDAQNFFEARSLFTRAHALYPNARTLRGLGVVELSLRNYDVAADLLSRALESNERPLYGELRKATQALFERARSFLATVTLQIEPASGARVLVDGELSAWSDGTPLVLKVGDHVIEVRAEGYEPERRTLRIQGGESLQVAFVLQANEEAAMKGATQPAEEATRPRPSQTMTATATASKHSAGVWPWIVVGSGAALLVTGGVLVFLGQSDIDEVENAKPGTPWSELRDAHERGPMLATSGVVLAVTGAATVTGGLLWYFLGGSDDEVESSTQVRVGLSHVEVTARF